MKNKYQKILISSLLLCSIPISAQYIPDLFGAYQRGAESARSHNAYQNYQPTFMVGVYAQGSSQPKSHLFGATVSIKKKEELCWMLYNIPSHTTYQTQELFIQPHNGLFNATTTNNIVGSKRTSENSIIFFREVSSGNANQIDGCYRFDETSQKGKYQLIISIGEYRFNPINFKVVN